MLLNAPTEHWLTVEKLVSGTGINPARAIMAHALRVGGRLLEHLR